MSAITADVPFRTARPTVRTRRPAEGDTPLRLTRRGRVVLFVLALGLALGGMLGNQAATAGTPGAAVPVETYTVQVGETMWSIASRVASPGEDVRDVVERLVDLNGLTGAGLVAGQQLLLPAAD